jgi:streptogramin lyase
MHGRVRSYSLPDDVAPVGLMAGTDGNLWFQAGDVGIGRITPTGRVKVFRVGSVPVHGGGALSIGVPPDPFPSRDILASSDGSIWFVARKDHLGRITPTGDVEVFKAPRGSLDPRNALSRLVLGPDQCVWFFGRDGASIVRFDTGIAPG